MCIDRPAIEKPLEGWVISDKESLIAWVRRFLWHYEGVCSGNGLEEAPDEPEVAIVENIIKVLKSKGESKISIKKTHLPNPLFYFQSECSHQLKSKKHDIYKNFRHNHI